MYRDGKGVKADAATALRWYRKAAEAGDGFAMYSIGRAYTEGSGVEVDPKQAYADFPKVEPTRSPWPI